MWAEQEEVVVGHSVDLTFPISLFVLGAAGFGRPISWKEDAMVPLGHQLPFKNTLRSVREHYFYISSTEMGHGTH
ncbi:hypothetical protein BDR04DRAFT_830736 [Suillus decipiens]|nr:hypothetical protein BDR04DRAFT_830736 [Suillus decipiens]